MRIFLLLLMISFMHLGCSGSRASPDDMRKILCSVSPSVYDTVVALCEKLPNKERRKCQAAVSIARAGHIGFCGLQSSEYKFGRSLAAARTVSYHQLE